MIDIKKMQKKMKCLQAASIQGLLCLYKEKARDFADDYLKIIFIDISENTSGLI